MWSVDCQRSNAKWRLGEDDLARLAALQAAILDEAAAHAELGTRGRDARLLHARPIRREPGEDLWSGGSGVVYVSGGVSWGSHDAHDRC